MRVMEAEDHVEGHSWLHSVFQASLGYKGPRLKTKQNKTPTNQINKPQQNSPILSLK